MLEDFGVDPVKMLVQVLIVLVPAVWATLRVLKNRRGMAALPWLGLVWFAPLVRPVAALLMVRGSREGLTSRKTLV